MAKKTNKAVQTPEPPRPLEELVAEAQKVLDAASAAVDAADAKIVAASDAGDRDAAAAALEERDRADALVAEATAALTKLNEPVAPVAVAPEAPAPIPAANSPFLDLDLDEGREADPRHLITVIGPVKGRRRCGYAFGAVPASVWVTDDELAQIKADTSLSVSMGAAPRPDPATGRPAIAGFLQADGSSCAVSVIGPAKGRRRAGRTFGAAAQTFTPTREELEAILADTALSVQPA